MTSFIVYIVFDFNSVLLIFHLIVHIEIFTPIQRY